MTYIDLQFDRTQDTQDYGYMSEQKTWITTAEAAAIMEITPQAVQRLCRKKGIDCEKFGRDWMVNKASAETYKPNPGGRGKKTGIDGD